MGVTQGKPSLPHLRDHIRRFDDHELVVLRQLFKDLASRSGGLAIDKETFLKYFPLPGLWGERLFEKFNLKGNAYIDFEEFLTGLAICCRGTSDEKMRFLFDMYDLTQDGYVAKNEMICMLHNLPHAHKIMSIHAYLNEREELKKSLIHPSASTPVAASSASSSEMAESHAPPPRSPGQGARTLGRSNSKENNQTPSPSVRGMKKSSSSTDVTKLPGNEEFWTPEEIQRLADKIIEDCAKSKPNELSYAEFKSWLQANPQFLNMFVGTFHEDTWGNDVNNNSNVKHPLTRAASSPNALEVLRDTNNAQQPAPVTAPQKKKSFLKLKQFFMKKRKPFRPLAAKCANCNCNIRTCNRCGVVQGTVETNKHKKIGSSGRKKRGSDGTATPPPSLTPPLPSPREEGGGSESPVELVIRYICNACKAQQQQQGQVGEIDPGVCADCHLPMRDDDSVLNSPTATSPRLPHEQERSTTPTPGGQRLSLSAETPQIYGPLYKLGRRTHGWKSRYYVLKDNLLYYYRSMDDTRPCGVIFLEGCFVEPLRDVKSNKYGLVITHESDLYPKHALYTQTEEERNQWLKKVQKGARVQNIEELYQMKEEIGHGKFSHVHVAVERSTGIEYAVKVIDKTSLNVQEKELLRSEIAIMKLLHHPHVIAMKDIFNTKQYIYIVMELVKGGELFDAIVGRKYLTEIESARIVKQLLSTTNYLHACGIIHRDLKPENILLSSAQPLGDIKITDFGLSKLVGPSDILKVPCGTLAYVAPEVLTMEGYDKGADVWSIGVIMYLLLRGRLPFDSRDKEVIIQKTLEGRLDFSDDHWQRISDAAKDLIRKLLKTDPSQRITIDAAMQHPWIVTPSAVIIGPLPASVNRFKSSSRASSTGSAAASTPSAPRSHFGSAQNQPEPEKSRPAPTTDAI
eukprot:GILK01004370.1.p1 GENE.GILK01004370.1~~GILK01004370.1.p1  ORF type:complete len:931 (+),score=151.79 GILK01004370.1:61-2793(+)